MSSGQGGAQSIASLQLRQTRDFLQTPGVMLLPRAAHAACAARAERSRSKRSRSKQSRSIRVKACAICVPKNAGSDPCFGGRQIAALIHYCTVGFCVPAGISFSIGSLPFCISQTAASHASPRNQTGVGIVESVSVHHPESSYSA